jgi:hypothetical protein
MQLLVLSLIRSKWFGRTHEEDGNVVGRELLSAGGVTRSLVGRGIAPRVDVVSPEVNVESAVGAAVEVVGHVDADIRVIRGSVTDTHGPVALALDVSLGVTDSSLDEGAGLGGVLGVGDLVTGEEAERVGVGSKSIDDREVTLVQVVVPGGVVAVDGLVGGGKVGHDVDASICEHVHAIIVVLGGVNGVNTDRVCAQSSEVRNIARADGCIGQRVRVRRVGAVGHVLLVCDTAHEELGAVGLVEELGALDDNGVDVSSDLGDEHARSRDGCSNTEALHNVNVDACLGVDWFKRPPVVGDQGLERKVQDAGKEKIFERAIK